MGSKNSLDRSSLGQAGLPVQRQTVSKNNNTGLPDNLKSGIENLSGHSMDDVKVHYNSDKPAQLQAHAYAQGTDIHLASGQEQHLPHEAWHVVQQKQGRVQATTQLKGVGINNNAGLEKEADVMGAKALNTESAVEGKSFQKGSVASSTSPVQRITKDEFDQQVTDQDLFDKSGSFYKDVNNNDIDKGKAWSIIEKHAGKNLKQLNKDQAIDIIHHLHRDQVTKDKKGKMHQNTHDMDQLYDRAELVHQHFEKEIKKLGKQYGAIEAKVPEGLKKRPRAAKKVDMKYKGDASRLNDLVRATMIFKSYKDMNNAIKSFKKDYNAVVKQGLLDVKDEREIKNKGVGSGYTDVKLIFPFLNHNVELQMNVKAMQDLKDSGGHALYDILRFFDEDQNATKFTPPTPQKQQKMLQQMTKIKKYIAKDAYLSVNKGYQRVVKSVIKDLKNGDGTITINNRKDIDLLREVSYEWYKQADDKMSASGQMVVRAGSLIERSTTYEH
ncbi:hypothetical protein GCM10009122_13430 [Fulvivirga kasyanovii]